VDDNVLPAAHPVPLREQEEDEDEDEDGEEEEEEEEEERGGREGGREGKEAHQPAAGRGREAPNGSTLSAVAERRIRQAGDEDSARSEAGARGDGSAQAFVQALTASAQAPARAAVPGGGSAPRRGIEALLSDVLASASVAADSNLVMYLRCPAIWVVLLSALCCYLRCPASAPACHVLACAFVRLRR
jgi:hypothetical protein